MGKIIVDRGLEEYTIEDKKGNILGKFEMNPADMEIVKRYEEVADTISHIADNIDDSRDMVDILREMEEKVYKQIDYLFNAEVSQNFFSITSPFTVLASGEFFIENILNAIGKLIEAETGKRFERVQTKISKYTSKYHGNSKAVKQDLIDKYKENK